MYKFIGGHQETSEVHYENLVQYFRDKLENTYQVVAKYLVWDDILLHLFQRGSWKGNSSIHRMFMNYIEQKYPYFFGVEGGGGSDVTWGQQRLIFEAFLTW